MKISELIIKNFGGIQGKKLRFSEGINLIYGKNESGKSTVFAFVKAMLFGMERGRGRASVNDAFSLYEPWENPNFYSGSMRFESGGRNFCISRNFDRYTKKTEFLCEDDGEQLSIEDGDLEMVLDGLNEHSCENTVAIGQRKAQTEQTLALELKNFATNYYAAGDGNLDLGAAILSLQKRGKELDREAKNELEEKQQKREKIEQESSYVWRDIHRLGEEQETLEEEIAIRKEREAEEKRELENKRVLDEIRPEKWRIHPVELVLFVLIVAAAFALIHKPWNYLVAIILSLCCGIYVWNRMKVGKKKVKTEPERILEEITPVEEKIPMERLYWQMERLAEELRDKKIVYENLREQLGELDEMGDSYKDREKKRTALQMAVNRLNKISEEFQNQLEDRLNQRVSEIVSGITNGKYSRLIVEEDLKISVLYGHRRIPVERLSRGTLEQIYFALRMAAGELMYEEEYPVILDDTFAFYDEERLENTLRWLAGHKKQVLILTCQRREEKALERMQIPCERVIF